ncbi:methyltransferase domain-containing protein [Clostridium sp. AF18-27]|uniref:class I SAM-dependent methyltransferase n=1 Tax=Enterocloster lavalensis TaxID=460384 RepID=UPI000E4F0442|nr:class I SAM-dependent methyltransferase [Enterocloster lavalensis]RHR48028.1 methyltransferase domain-containing protein [Clostridium sp. AF18-27]
MDDTLQYYDQHAKAYVDSTRDVEFSQTQERFLQYLEPGARILDFGCGSGRDTKYFRNRGFQVEAVDGSAEFVRIASEYTGINVRRMLFQDLDEVERYDGIWACSSILHLPCAELEVVLGKMARALRRRGIVYTSFKYGTEEGERSGRYFTNMTEAKMAGLLERIPVYDVEEMWVTFDVRPGRGDERWLNMILRKR